jgi:hypothetical protein
MFLSCWACDGVKEAGKFFTTESTENTEAALPRKKNNRMSGYPGSEKKDKDYFFSSRGKAASVLSVVKKDSPKRAAVLLARVC